MATYGFSENDAKRIGRVVRLVERGAEKTELGGPKHNTPPPGVRLMLGKIGSAAWPQNTTATITVYTGDPGSETTAGTTVARNYFANISTSTSTARWVGVSNNGFGWVLIAAECD